MIREIEERFFRSVLDGPFGDASRILNVSGSLSDLKLHGTTTGAFLIEEGKAALLFGDGKVTRGDKSGVVSHDFCKLFRIDKRSCVAIAGALGTGVEFVSKLEAMIGFAQDSSNRSIPIDLKTYYLQQLQKQNLPLAAQGFEVAMIFVTFDVVQSHAARIFKVMSDSSRIERPFMDSLGSGQNSADPRLKDKWKTGMTEQDGIDLVRHISTHASDEDNFTGGTWLVWRVDFDGVRELQRWPHE